MGKTKPYIVGITGGSGSGKTYFLQKLLVRLNRDKFCIISQDNYYLPRELQPRDEKGISNFDTTSSIDFESFAADLKKLYKGEKIVRKEYTYNNPDAQPRMLEFTPAPVIILEGIFVLHYPKLADLVDLKIFIEAREHIRLKRRIIRDSKERGYDLDDVLYRFEKHVSPTYEKYIKPLKHQSDIIIPNNSGFDKAVDVVTDHLKSILSG